MSNILILLIIVFIAPMAHAAPSPQEVENALAEVQDQKQFAKTWEGEHADKPYIALLSEYMTTINPDWSSVEVYHARVKIQKDAAKELAQWPIYYNKSREEISDIEAFVETPEGKRVAVTATNIQDLPAYDQAPMYGDVRVKVVAMPQVAVGSIIDVKVTTKTSHMPIPNQFWDEVPLPVIPTKLARHTYVFPQSMNIAFKAVNADDKPLIEKKNGMVRYDFVYHETGYTAEEELMPPADEVNGRLFFSSITDWKMVADWYRALVEKNTVADPELTVKALELAKDKTTQKDKARAILEYIQDNFRYVALNFGDHLVEPHPSNEVFKNRYGDCKDLALLARQMLLLAGVDARTCLFVHEGGGNPQNGLPNPSVFEHVILEVTVDGEHYFVDPQTKGFDLGQWPSDYDNANLFVIEEDNYRFDHIPVAKEEDNTIITTSDITINPDGSAVFEVKVKMSPEGSQSFRQAWTSSADKNKDKFFERLEATFAQGGSMIKRDVKGLENRYGSVDFDLKYAAPNAYPIVNDMILLKENNQGNIPEFADPKRVYSIFVGSNSLMKDTNTYHVPEGYQIDSVPPDYHLSIDFMDISTNYQKADRMVVTYRLLRMKRAKVGAERYGEVKNFRDEFNKKNDKYIVLKAKAGTVAPEAKDWIKK